MPQPRCTQTPTAAKQKVLSSPALYSGDPAPGVPNLWCQQGGVTEHTVPLCASIVTWKFGNGRLMQQEDTSHAIHPSTTGSTAMAHPTHVQECGALQQRWI